MFDKIYNLLDINRKHSIMILDNKKKNTSIWLTDLVDIAEQDIPSTIRMTVNTWSLIGAAPRYLEGDRLVHVQDVPLHPDNPHTPLTRRNMLMAHKLFKLQLDDTEAALLAITCILATGDRPYLLYMWCLCVMCASVMVNKKQ